MATPHFTDTELSCRCGCGGLPSSTFQAALEHLRVIYDAPMNLSSAYRCPAYNAEVSSTGLEGPHTKGAVDVLVYGGNAHALVTAAVLSGWTGIGINQSGLRSARFVHLDRLSDGPRPWVWSY